MSAICQKKEGVFEDTALQKKALLAIKRLILTDNELKNGGA